MDKAKLGNVLRNEGSLSSFPFPATGTEYFIEVPQVESSCISVDNTVSCAKNSVDINLNSNSIKYSESLQLRLRKVIYVNFIVFQFCTFSDFLKPELSNLFQK